jgi:hypothetical protein
MHDAVSTNTVPKNTLIAHVEMTDDQMYLFKLILPEHKDACVQSRIAGTKLEYST